MDTHHDFKPFQDLMDELSAALRDGFKAQDAMVRAYWDALKDVHLCEVRANVKRIIATATKETNFPKPRDLRNRSPIIESQPHNAQADAAARRSAAMWRELRKRDPVEYEILYRISITARELAVMSEDDPGYVDCEREHYRWTSLRYAPRAEQEQRLRAYLGRSP